ncbi:MAG: M48 family metallopeptidase [Candidatus Thermoplasmatota archaeon]|nr:M48 family metallopeptidase [Candidatus Thermoplasmatota archaeon]
MTASQITVIRSKRRKKTIQTKYGDGHLWIYLPAGMNAKDEQKWITRMIERNERWVQKKTLRNSDSWLLKRAQDLNKKYFEGSLDFSIRFVTNQNSRFGSCTSSDKTIRISERVKSMPSWVQDYILLHELAHLICPDHSKKFWGIVDQYRYAERAKGYLFAIGASKEEFTGESAPPDEC